MINVGGGYTFKLIEIDKISDEDRKEWREMQLKRENVRNHDKLVIPNYGAITFAKYKDEIVGCGCVEIISKDVAESKHLMILKEHRRKGLFKELMCLTFMYCYGMGITWLNLSPAIQKDYWYRIGAVKGWVTK